ncbi:putative YkwD family protein [Sinobaca qinghaiensis]|uniref:Putative YkwD family protein n=1 Tax=Sinobaca qinghaiensis TaxID=342944 RepID=A0A419V400_9BACL|nr:CAP domain-containing protein [Sinobaca qinghaiensis]RKD73220.1 putative YkwD family protein [Sinobaca qinghaiensis]
MKKVVGSLAVLMIFPVAVFAQSSQTYSVQEGDTLFGIAEEHDVSVEEVLSENPGIANENVISVNQSIAIPDTDGAAAEESTGQSAEAAPSETAAEPAPDSEVSESEAAFEQEVVRLTNVEREKAGLQPLQSYGDLAEVADAKSEDLRDAGYFAHESPNYGSPFDMMTSFGISYSAAGENIAAGQDTPEAVVNAWMNSEGHRENIMNENFTHIAIGYAEGGEYGTYWTQMFVTR